MGRLTDLEIPLSFAKKIYTIFISASFLWTAAIFAAPILLNIFGSNPVSSLIYQFFSGTCHQEESRSFFIYGHQIAVCSRCTSIYAAFLLGVAVYPFIYKLNNTKLPSLWFLLIPAGLMLADALFDITDIIKNTFVSRGITGFLIGFVLPFYLIPGFIVFAYEVMQVFYTSKTKANEGK